MRKWIVRGLLGLVVVVVALVATGLLLPGRYEVKRELLVDAPVERVHALVGDLNRWPEWGPWLDEDPTIRTTIGDKASGVGASQSWTGDSGSGELTFTRVDPERGVDYDLSFDDGAWKSVAYVHYAPQGEQTRVTWAMSGDAGANPIARWFALMLDAMAGPMFERGLEKLKAAAERG